jgi:putative N6-adenine-specific DNA methylase
VVREVVSALAVTAPGLAPLAARELRALGMTPTDVDVEGVSFRAPLTALYQANLWLRTASRVVVRVSAFHADSFHELERRAERVAWDRYITPGVAVRLRVTCRKSRLYHSDAVAERIAGAITRAGGVLATTDEPEVVDPPTDHTAELVSRQEPVQLVVVRMYRDECTISLDSSGALLHRRGYRQETAKAPLRETLAAAVLMASGWNAQGPLLDPMCGAGTLAIEGAWLARRRAPGLGRDFSFMQWPEFDASAWDVLVEEARGNELQSAPVSIQASDRDAGATAATLRNAARAGVAGDVDVTTRTLSDIDPRRGPGWLVTNPPYGVRLGESRPLRDLYARLGQVARSKCPGWTVTLLAADRALLRQTGLSFVGVLRTVNGGIAVEAVTARISG